MKNECYKLISLNKLIVSIAFIVFIQSAFSQNYSKKQIDSTFSALKVLPNNTKKVDQLVELYKNSSKSGFTNEAIIDEAITISEKIFYIEGLAKCYDRKGLTARQKILDYMGSTELIANLFRISQTKEKLRKDRVEGAEAAIKVHYSVGKEVRSAIEKIGGTMPEDLPVPEKSIQQIEKEQMKCLRDKAKKAS